MSESLSISPSLHLSKTGIAAFSRIGLTRVSTVLRYSASMCFSTIFSTVLDPTISLISARNSRSSSSILPLQARPRHTENSGSAPVITTASGNASLHQSLIAGSLETPPVRKTSSGRSDCIFSLTCLRLAMNTSLKLLPPSCGIFPHRIYSAVSLSMTIGRRIGFS